MKRARGNPNANRVHPKKVSTVIVLAVGSVLLAV